MQVYGVVTMDLVNSRNLLGRVEIQDKLISYIKYVNHKYSSLLVAPIDFTLGDEWQLITNAPHKSYNLIHEFQQLFWNDDIKFYAGIGIGLLSTKIYDSTRKMDGSCFIAAREAINIAKQKSNVKKNPIHSKDNRIFFQSDKQITTKEIFLNKKTSNFPIDNKEVALTLEKDTYPSSIFLDDILNSLIENTEILKEKMTQKQKSTYISYKKMGSYRKMIALDSNYFDDSISAISQRLNAANYFTIENNHNIIESLLYDYCRLKEV